RLCRSTELALLACDTESRDDDAGQLRRRGRESEVLGDRAAGERDADRSRLVANPSGRERDGLTAAPRRRHGERIPTIFLAVRTDSQRWNGDARALDRVSALAYNASG